MTDLPPPPDYPDVSARVNGGEVAYCPLCLNLIEMHETPVIVLTFDSLSLAHDTCVNPPPEEPA
jgi:hypothetical protein